MMPLLSILSCIGCLTGYMVYLLIDDRTANHTDADKRIKFWWHLFGGLLHGWCAVHISLLYGWQWGLLSLSALWLVFDGCINLMVLNRSFFYVGTTSLMDKAQRWIAARIGISPEEITAILKGISLITTIILANYAS